MFKTKKIPTLVALRFLFWSIAIISIFSGGYLLLLASGQVSYIIWALIISIGGVLFAALIRMIGNLSQLLFDLNDNLRGLNRSLSDNSRIIQSEIQNQTNLLSDNLAGLNRDSSKHAQDMSGQVKNLTMVLSENLQELKSGLAQINCDSKDINQSIYQIKVFFEQIARELDLKK